MRGHDGRWLGLWALVVAVVLLGPAAFAGLGGRFVLTYDMVWVPDLALNRDVLGLSSALPRAVPSDALIAALDEVVPGSVLQTVVLLGSLWAAGAGAARLLPDSPLAARLGVVALYEWNAFVVERLAIGHWPVLVGYALLPWIVVAARRWRDDGRGTAALLVLVPLASLSASAGLITAVVLVATAGARGRRLGLLAVVACANAPWIVAGLLHASTAVTDPAGARAFALHDEGGLPGPVAALTLGGIWNGEVVPGSRLGVLGWVATAVLVALACAGVRRWRERDTPRDRTGLVACWAVGFAMATLTWLAPGAVGRVGENVPGLGLVRDGARMLALCAPLLVVLAGHGIATLSESVRLSRTGAAAAAVAAALLPVSVMPDAAWGNGGRLGPADFPDSWQQARQDLAVADPPGLVLVLPLSSFRRPDWNQHRTTFDPLGRYLGRRYVASDVFSVSGRVIAGEDPMIPEVERALAVPGKAERTRRLSALGIGAVAVDRTAPGGQDVPEVRGATITGTRDLSVTVLAGSPARGAGRGMDPFLMGAAWAAYLALIAGGLGALLRARFGKAAQPQPH